MTPDIKKTLDMTRSSSSIQYVKKVFPDSVNFGVKKITVVFTVCIVHEQVKYIIFDMAYAKAKYIFHYLTMSAS